MTQKEFEQIACCKVKVGEWSIVETLYMSAGDMDKQSFCKELRKMCAIDGATDEIDLRECLKEISRHSGSLEKTLREFKRSTINKNKELAMFLIGKAHAYEDSDFRKQAISLIGEQAVVRATLEMGLPLWNEDRAMLMDMLKEEKYTGNKL